MSYPYGGVAPRKVRYEWISEAWALFMAQVWTWVLAAIVYLAITFGVSGAQNVLTRIIMPSPGTTPATAPSGAAFGAFVVLMIVGYVVSLGIEAYLMAGFYRMANKAVRGEPVTVGDLFSGGPVFWPMLGFYLLASIVIGVGFVFCVFPGLVLAGLLYPGYALIADGEGVGNAFSRAIDAMKGDWLSAALFVLVWGLVGLLAIVCTCGIGLVAIYPMMYLIGSLMYRDMVGMPQAPAFPGYAVPAAPAGAWPPPPQATPASPQMPMYPPAPHSDIAPAPPSGMAPPPPAAAPAAPESAPLPPMEPLRPDQEPGGGPPADGAA